MCCSQGKADSAWLKSIRNDNALGFSNPLLLRCRRCGLSWRCCFLRWTHAARPAFHNRDVINFHRTIRAVVRIAAHPGDLLYQRNGGVIALAEDGVMAIQHVSLLAGECRFSYEELSTVGIRASVCVCEASGTVEFQIRGDFGLKCNTYLAAAAPGGIAALNHEVGDHAMENCSVVERHAVFFSV